MVRTETVRTAPSHRRPPLTIIWRQDQRNDPPLLDPQVLDRLRAEVDNDEQGVWTVLVHNFLAVLPDRTEGMRLTLTTGDLPGALDAVLSLKSSSQMVGAERLAVLAFHLERTLRVNTYAEPDRVLPQLAAALLRPIMKCNQQTAALLSRCLHVRAAS